MTVPASPIGPNDSPATVERRTALKAALGGATVAAVFAAPRIKGFSVAPDYAAAASCTSGTAVISHNTNGVACLGNGALYNCGEWTSSPTAVGSPLMATVKLGGALNSGGYMNVNVNGITNNTYQTCTVRSNSVNQNGSCGGWNTSTSSMVKSDNNVPVSNLTFNRANSCNARAANMGIWVTVSCTCS